MTKDNLEYNPLTQEMLLKDESVLSISNGYIGVRGNLEEGCPKEYESRRGTYLSGIYETIGNRQQLIPVFDGQSMELWLEGERFSLFEGEIRDSFRRLNIEDGFVERYVKWRSPKGREIEVTFRRMASFEKPEMVLITCQVKSLNFNGQLKIVSVLEAVGDAQADVSNLMLMDVRMDEALVLMNGRTTRTGFSVTTAMIHSLPMEMKQQDHSVYALHRAELKQGQSLSLDKYLIYTDSIRHGHPSAVAEAYAREAIAPKKESWLKAQKDYLKTFWGVVDVYIHGADKENQTMKVGLYQMMASAGKDGYSSVAARGLCGSDEERGVCDWTTEIFILPFFTLTNPRMARDLLQFRYAALAHSRAHAIAMGHSKGAKMAVKTISGTEDILDRSSGASHYHVNGAVAYSYLQYYYLTGDLGFMEEYGAELLLETARLWLDIGNYDSSGRFVLNCVTGPDEYTAIANNNFYTNSLAAYHLRGTVSVLEALQEHMPTSFKRLSRRLGIESKELLEMTQAANHMHLPVDHQLGIDLQDDSFNQKAAWDLKATTPGKPLEESYNLLTLYRHKVLKQADTILAHQLLDERPIEVMKASYHYYKKCTTEDSSLTPVVATCMAARIGEAEEAGRNFEKLLKGEGEENMDLSSGQLIAEAGGAYIALVYGFGGLRIKAEGVTLRPMLPPGWTSYGFRFQYGEANVSVTIGQDITIHTTQPIELTIYDENRHIQNKGTFVLR